MMNAPSLWFYLLLIAALGCTKEAPARKLVKAEKVYWDALSFDGGAVRDLGLRFKGEYITEHFHVTNMSNKPIQLSELLTSSSIAVVNVDKTDIAPGESANLVVSVDTGKGDSTNTNVEIRTNRGNYFLQIDWRYNFSVDLDYLSRIEFDAYVGEESSLPIVLSRDLQRCYLEAAVVFPDEVSSASGLDFDLDVCGDSCRLALSVAPGFLPEILNAEFQLKDKHDDQVILAKPIRIRVRDRIEIASSQVVFRDVGEPDLVAQLCIRAEDATLLEGVNLAWAGSTVGGIDVDRIKLDENEILFEIRGSLEELEGLSGLRVLGPRGFDKLLSCMKP